VAREVDRAVPGLEERWSTVAELSSSNDPAEMLGAESMAHQVRREAVGLEHLVQPEHVTSTNDVKRSLIPLGGLVLAFLVLFVLDWQQMSVLLGRFFSPGANISLTRVVSESGDASVPRGEPFTLAAITEDRPREAATLFLRDDSGDVETISLVPTLDNQRRFERELAAVETDFEYRFRAGDGQTPWHRIEAVDRPQLAGIEFRITPPEYSRLPEQLEAGLPRRTRALQGSKLEVEFRASEPLREMRLNFGKDHSIVVPSKDGTTFRFETVLNETLTLSPLLTSAHGLTNEKPPTCIIVVYRDRAPTLKVSSLADDVAVRPDDSITIELEAKDDFGIARAEISVYDGPLTGDPEVDRQREIKRIEIPLDGSSPSNDTESAKDSADANNSPDSKDPADAQKADKTDDSRKAADAKDSNNTADAKNAKDSKHANNSNDSPDAKGSPDAQDSHEQPHASETPNENDSADASDAPAPKELRAVVDLDLKEFDLKNGSELNYVVRVFDNRPADGNQTAHTANDNPESSQPDAQPSEQQSSSEQSNIVG
jgi:hypothetical protein